MARSRCSSLSSYWLPYRENITVSSRESISSREAALVNVAMYLIRR